MRVVVKLGGSLIKEAPGLVDRLVKEFGPGKESFKKAGMWGKEKASGTELPGDYPLSGNDPACVLIVPGGGIFADTVREADRALGLGEDASHWMAVLGMEQYACYLLDRSKASAAYSRGDLSPGVSVLFPYGLLKSEDPLPHSWDVSSDTIAAWVAKQTGARLVKATDVDGVFGESGLIEEISAAGLAAAGTSCTDRALPEFLLKNGMDCTVVNGKFPERVLLAVYGRPVPGTVVKGNI